MQTQASKIHRKSKSTGGARTGKSAGAASRKVAPAAGRAKPTPAKSKAPPPTHAPAVATKRLELPAKPPRSIARFTSPAPPRLPDVASLRAQRAAQEKQRQQFEEAVRLFHAQKFDRAEALFQRALEGPNRTLAHHAQVHAQICAKRLHPPAVSLKTADDHYNYAVTLINARKLQEAAAHLETALHLAPQGDHIHYAMAAAQALQGNPQGAYERLKTAIDLQPRNRILARGDADFAGILEYPPLASLLQSERGGPVKTP